MDFVIYVNSSQKWLVILSKNKGILDKSSRENVLFPSSGRTYLQYPIFPSYKEDKMADNYDGMAVGVFELDNLVACFVALDAASGCNVKIRV